MQVLQDYLSESKSHAEIAERLRTSVQGVVKDSPTLLKRKEVAPVNTASQGVRGRIEGEATELAVGGPIGFRRRDENTQKGTNQKRGTSKAEKHSEHDRPFAWA